MTVGSSHSVQTRFYQKTLIAGLLFASPCAQVARESGNRLLYLPLNGVQRLLIYSTLYLSYVLESKGVDYIKKIRDKEKFAHLLTAVFSPSALEPPVNETRQEEDSWPILRWT